MKKLISILMMAFAVAMISCSNEDITGNGGDSSPPPPDTTITFTLNNIPTDFSLTDNIWKITDSDPVSPEPPLDFADLKDALIEADKAGRKIKLVFPNIETIPDNAFKNCSGLTSISLPAATDIGNFAFNGCEDLTSISLPSATSIGVKTFVSCTSLTTVTLPAATSIGDFVFTSCTALKTMTIATESTLTTLNDNAFTGVRTENITVTTHADNVDKFTANSEWKFKINP